MNDSAPRPLRSRVESCYRDRPARNLSHRVVAAVQIVGLGCVLAATAACGSGSGASAPPGNGGGGGGGGNSGGGGNPPALQPSFASIQQNVFTPLCTGCHSGATAPQGLRLDEASSYGLLVGVPSAQQPSIRRVAPGEPRNSYLIHKLEGTAAVGARMPLNGTPLAPADIDVIRQWITDGAQPPTPPQPPSAPLRVTSLSPLPETTLETFPAAIIAVFDRELDATSITADTFTLTASGGDGTFDDGNELAVTAASVGVGVAQNPPTSAVMDLNGVTASDDTYRVRLAGEGPVAILDLDSNALDGEFAGAFPSGDGTQGGDFIASFIVAAPPPGIQPSIESIQTNVLTPRCSGCHTGPASQPLPAGLDLSNADASFASLVGVASLEQPMVLRVAAGDPAASYLVHKIEGTAAVGGRMPLFSDPLEPDAITAIREWISLGAVR